MDDKNTAQNPLTPTTGSGSSTPFHSDMDVPPPPSNTPVAPPSFVPPVVHEELPESPVVPVPQPPTPPPPPVPPVEETSFSTGQAEHPQIHDDAPVGPINAGAQAPGGDFGGAPPVITSNKKGGKGKIFAAIAAVVLLLVSIPLGVILIRQNQEVREKAREIIDDCQIDGSCEDEGTGGTEETAPPAAVPDNPTAAPDNPTAAPAEPGNGGDSGGDSGETTGGGGGNAPVDCGPNGCYGDGECLPTESFGTYDGCPAGQERELTHVRASNGYCIRPDRESRGCQPFDTGSGGNAPLNHECAYPGQPSEEAGNSSTANCGGHKYCHYEGDNPANRLVWGDYQCNYCTNGANNPPNCNNNRGDCGADGGVCVGSSGICNNQGGYTSDASCSGSGSCCMGAAGSPSAPSTDPGTPGAPTTDGGATGGGSTDSGTGGGTVGTGSCVATISFEGVDQAWRQPASSPVSVCAPTGNSVSLTMVVTIPNNCPSQTVTWNETNATCPGTSYAMCPGPAGTPCSATPAQRSGTVTGGAPLRQTITTAAPSCGSSQIDMDRIVINGLTTNYGEGIRAFQNNCGPMACTDMVVYKYPYNAGNRINKTAIRPGDDLKFCIPNATTGTPMITINNGTPRVAQENGPTAGEKCFQFDVPDDATSLRVTGAL